MLKSQLLFGVSLAALGVAAAELAPYVPAPHQFQRVQTVPAAEIAVTAPDAAKKLTVGDFIKTRSLNGVWKCSGLETSARPIPADDGLDRKYAGTAFDDTKWDDIAVPLNWYKKYPKKQTSEEPYVRGYYRTSFNLTPEELKNSRIMLNFDVVGYDAKVFLNGVEVGNHHGDFTPFKLDVTGAAKAGKNVLAVRVFSDNGPTFGVREKITHVYGSQWSINNIKGGIWQDVTLSIEPELRIDRLTVTPDLAKSGITVDCRIVNPTENSIKVDLLGKVVSAMKGESGAPVGQAAENGFLLKPGVNDTTITVGLKEPKKWSIDAPYLYHFVLSLSERGNIVSAASARFGFREFHVRNSKFYLNGEEIYLFGENIPSVTYGGHGLSTAEEEKKLEKYILGCRNLGYVMLRNAHMPIMPKALEVADECGMMMFNEWGWCFSNGIDADAFHKVNQKELEEFFHATANHPSVAMWSLGNEVVHRNAPPVAREMDRQVELIRSLDKQKRPISTFSGAGGWRSYGETKLDTDVRDLHTYTALSSPWTKLPEELAEIVEGDRRIYGEKELTRPLVAWENVGFSWGIYSDPNFKRGDVREYAKYVAKPTTWGNPNGIGFTGVAPLFKALGPNFNAWAQAHYGRRIFEIYRLTPDYTGFAPWFSNSNLREATLWNQPVFPSLHTEALTFPRNFFADETTKWQLSVVNSGNDSFRNLVFDVAMVAEKDRSVTQAASFKIGDLAAQSRLTRPVELKMPALAPGHYQMRITLRDGSRTVGQNYYDTFVQDPGILSRKIETARPVRILDTGAAKNVAELEALLKAYQIPYKTVKSVEELKEAALLIVPPEIAEEQLVALGSSAELTNFIRNLGGTLLVLEQKNMKSRLPGNQAVTMVGNTFVDLVIPDHPVFAGLDYRSFDTWNNPDKGYVVAGTFVPFTLNAVAAKGPMLGRQDVGMALVEATDGKGRIILSQLEATACRKLDSVAATYLYNLIDYAAGADYWKGALPLADAVDRDYTADKENLVFIDLAEKANVPFRDEVDNDGKGGWTDQGTNDFRMMPLGVQEAAGIRFNILDPDKNNGRSCLVVRGSERQHFPAAIRDIKVGRKLSRLFFLHTAAWGGKGKAGAYRINFADGTHLDYPIEGNQNIGDWWTVAQLPAAKIGILRKNAMDHEVGTFVAEWENPKPDVEIKSIDFLSATEARGNEIDWLPSGTPIPVLVAVTGEKVSDKLLDITGSRFVRAAGLMEHGSTVPAEVKTVKTGSGVQLDISFKASPPKEIPAVLISYDKKDAAADYRYLTFQAKSPEEAVIQVVLPREDWQARLRGDVTLKGDNRWHKYRLMVGRNFENENGFSFDKQRGELFLYYRSLRAPDTARPALNFEIKDITLE